MLEQLNKIFKICDKNLTLLSRATLLQIGFIAPKNTIYNPKPLKALSADKCEKVTKSFIRSLELIPYYKDFTDESVLIRDMLLQIGGELNLFPFAGAESGDVFFCDFPNATEEIEEILACLSNLFSQTFGYPLSIKVPEKDLAINALRERLKSAKDFYLNEQGPWIAEFMTKLGDDLSHVSFMTFLRQRILAKVFSASDICYPVKPPAATASWRKERENAEQAFPIMHNVKGELLNELHFRYVYTYSQYAIEGQVEPKPGDTVIDAGAFIGDTASWFADMVQSHGKVFSFEPSKRNAEQGIKNMRANDINNVTFYQYALSDHHDKVFVIENESSTGANRVSDINENALGDPIEMLALDELRNELGVSAVYQS